MRIVAMLTGLCLLNACATATTPPAQAAVATEWFTAPLTFETTSWGKPVSHFQVAPDGSAEVWNFSPVPGGGFYDYTVVKFRGVVAPEALARFKADFAPYATGTAPRPGDCRNYITDAPSSWVGTERQKVLFSVYHGCLDKEAVAYADKAMSISAALRTSIVLEAQPYATETYPPKPTPPKP